MSNLFTSPTFRSPQRKETTGASKPSSSYYDLYANLGLRQRHSSNRIGFNDPLTTTRANDENANPNETTREIPNYQKWGAIKSNVPAPPRMSLATAGKSALKAGSVATQQHQQQVPSEKTCTTDTNYEAPAIVLKEDCDDDERSLWILAYGFRTESQFRALLSRLESCGTITSRRGGLSFFGESRSVGDDDGRNWVALRYESSLAARKALCLNGAFLNVGGSTIIIGVTALVDSDAAVKLGFNISGSTTSSCDTAKIPKESQFFSRGDYNRGTINSHALSTEADIMLHEDEQEDTIHQNDSVKSGLDSLCAKVLAWFFIWDESK